MSDEYRIVRINYDHLEDIVEQYMYAYGILKDNEQVEYIDLPLEIDDEGMVEVEIKIAG